MALAFLDFFFSKNFYSELRPECREGTHCEEKNRLYCVKQGQVYHKVLQGLNIIIYIASDLLTWLFTISKNRL